MRSFARRHPMPAFLVIVYSSAPRHLRPATPVQRRHRGHRPRAAGRRAVRPAVRLSLVAAAFVTTALADGRDGVRELRRRVFRFRVSPALVRRRALRPALVAVAAAAFVRQQPASRRSSATRTSCSARSSPVQSSPSRSSTGGRKPAGPVSRSIGSSRSWGRSAPASSRLGCRRALHLPLVFIAGGVTVGRVPPSRSRSTSSRCSSCRFPVRMLITWIYNASGRSVPIAGSTTPASASRTNPDFTDSSLPGLHRRPRLRGLRGRRGGRAGHHPGAARLRRRIDLEHRRDRLSRCDHRLSREPHDRRVGPALGPSAVVPLRGGDPRRRQGKGERVDRRVVLVGLRHRGRAGDRDLEPGWPPAR